MYIKQTHSTSTLLREQYTDDLPHLYTIRTDFQTAGRGQAGNSWESEEGKNLLFSSLLRYEGIYAADQWRLSMLVAVACWEVLAKYLPKDWLTIKWPNDIYVDDRKICGILIENSLRDSHISSSIVGIGLNVNQRNFDDSIKNPTSIVLCNDTNGDRNYDLKQCLTEFMDIFKSYANRYLHMNGGYRSLRRLYLARLWRKDQLSGFIDFTTLPSGHLDGPMEIYSTDMKHSAGREFKGIIRGLSDIGNLLVEDQTSGTVREFGFKEIGYIL